MDELIKMSSNNYLFQMIAKSLFPVAEGYFDQALRYDPDTHVALKTIEGKSLRVDITDMGVAIHLSITEGRFNFREPTEGDVVATEISGASFDLLKLMSGKRFQSGHIRIQGDPHLAQDLQKIFQDLNPDWEEALSQWIGDTPAYEFGRVARRFKSFGKNIAERLPNHATEVLQEEYQLFPTRKSVGRWMNEVSELRQAVDRLEARLKNLQP